MASPVAKRLRKDPTEAEKHLWDHLRRRRLDGFRFRRQVPLGPYIVDFACFSKRIIVEVDGGQHAIHQDEDQIRTAKLEGYGYRVMRFWNNDVLANTDGVLETIRAALLSTD